VDHTLFAILPIIKFYVNVLMLDSIPEILIIDKMAVKKWTVFTTQTVLMTDNALIFSVKMLAIALIVDHTELVL